MLEPKEFYRKLDALFSKINIVKSGANFLFTIVEEIEIEFGKDLHIGKGFIYEKNGDEFILISPLSYSDDIVIEQELTVDSNIVQAIINSKTYIFDNPIFGFTITDIGKKEYRIPAAIIVHNNEQKWIILFEIKSGWIREEIEFCLNATRAILNYRLLSESIKFEFEQAFLIQKSLLLLHVHKYPVTKLQATHNKPNSLVEIYSTFINLTRMSLRFVLGTRVVMEYRQL